YVRVPDRLVMRMDGKGYPWHFDGVATVVRRLFEIVNPTKAYFGQKDIQQLAILDSMNQWLNTGIDIVQVPIFRDADGLSSSSRLTLLDPHQRSIAINVTQIINQHSKQSGQQAKTVLESLKNALNELSVSEDQLQVDAIECIDPKSLDPAMVIGQNSALYVAFVINGLRLAETRWCE
ncbi:MAG: pantoate--beta-alanine ligase, partial [Phycisphaerales bacterium]|nr:pantoate--beta-alanine ligase [Phycisphaerales bacterium]